MTNIVDKTWFTTPAGCMGIVLVEDDLGERKAYIGIARCGDEDADALDIADWGASFPLSAAKTFFPYKC